MSSNIIGKYLYQLENINVNKLSLLVLNKHTLNKQTATLNEQTGCCWFIDKRT